MKNEGSGYDLPRPALGRRPWFAFLRRARMRRRFAFAMGRERTSAAARCHFVELRSPDGWHSGPVRLATSGADRIAGLRPVPGPHGLLMAARSIHTWGMRSQLGWAALDGFGLVVSTGVACPGRVVVRPAARFFLELPLAALLPPPGAALEVNRLGS